MTDNPAKSRETICAIQSVSSGRDYPYMLSFTNQLTHALTATLMAISARHDIPDRQPARELVSP